MIRVNLAKRKKSGAVQGASGGGLSSFLERFRGGGGGVESVTPETKSALIKFVILGAVAFGAYYILGDMKQKRLDEVRAQLEQLQAKSASLDKEIAGTEGYEKIRTDLEAAEKAIRNKIDTIERLVNDRTTPPKILITLSQATPSDVWLTDFQLRDQSLRISGASAGLSIVSDFMRSIDDTIYFRDVALKRSTQTKQDGMEIATFELEARRR